jgi:hypothetical protein
MSHFSLLSHSSALQMGARKNVGNDEHSTQTHILEDSDQHMGSVLSCIIFNTILNFGFHFLYIQGCMKSVLINVDFQKQWLTFIRYCTFTVPLSDKLACMIHYFVMSDGCAGYTATTAMLSHLHMFCYSHCNRCYMPHPFQPPLFDDHLSVVW